VPRGSIAARKIAAAIRVCDRCGTPGRVDNQGCIHVIDAATVDPPRTCQVEHDHWEGPMICGNELPCARHGGSR